MSCRRPMALTRVQMLRNGNTGHHDDDSTHQAQQRQSKAQSCMHVIPVKQADDV